MKIGDMVRFESESASAKIKYMGIVVAESIPNAFCDVPFSVDVLWASGYLTEAMPPRILKVINE
jgi:hypothetical protein